MNIFKENVSDNINRVKRGFFKAYFVTFEPRRDTTHLVRPLYHLRIFNAGTIPAELNARPLQKVDFID